MRLIDADALYERACSLEAQALDYVGKLIERDGDEPSVEWRVWSAILTERTAFKHDVFDAPTVQPERKKGTWIPVNKNKHYGNITTAVYYYPKCSVCGLSADYTNFCPNCGADMRGTDK